MTSLPSDVQTLCTYELDSSLNLLSVDDGWDVFAVRNGAPELVRSRVVGQSVLASIADPTTAELYVELFRRVGTRGVPVTIPFRCDSPTVRRFLTLTIEPSPAGFRMTSTVVRTESRPLQSLLWPAHTDGQHSVQMCSWCKRVEAAGSWLEVEEAAASLDTDASPVLRHAICDQCRNEMARFVEAS